MRSPTLPPTAALALAAFARAVRTGADPVRALDEQARAEGVAPGSETYDDAAELLGFPYSRALDMYVPREMRDRAGKLHFSEAHLALLA